mgnify:CR=1 FL=1
MKKLLFVLFAILVITGCRKDMSTPPSTNPLDIKANVGVALQTTFVTNDVKINVKSDVAQNVTIKILDISNKAVSKSTTDVVAGDNILTVYSATLPTAAYRLAVYDNKGTLLAITDFNKL